MEKTQYTYDENVLLISYIKTCRTCEAGRRGGDC